MHAVDETAEAAAGTDGEFLEALLRQPGNRDALSWLREDSSRTRWIGKHPRVLPYAKALALVDELYQTGAVRVTAVELDPEETTTRTLIVELPDGVGPRTALFHTAADLSRKQGFDPVADTGQRLLLLWWD